VATWWRGWWTWLLLEGQVAVARRGTRKQGVAWSDGGSEWAAWRGDGSDPPASAAAVEVGKKVRGQRGGGGWGPVALGGGPRLCRPSPLDFGGCCGAAPREAGFRHGVWLARVTQLRLLAWLARRSSPVRLLLGCGSDDGGVFGSSFPLLCGVGGVGDGGCCVSTSQSDRAVLMDARLMPQSNRAELQVLLVIPSVWFLVELCLVVV
jgi:hypothetical protein